MVRGFLSHEIPSLLQLNPGECEQQFSGHFRRKRRQQLRRLGHGRRKSNNVKQSQPDGYSPISSQRSRLERLHVGTKLWIYIMESILAILAGSWEEHLPGNLTNVWKLKVAISKGKVLCSLDAC